MRKRKREDTKLWRRKFRLLLSLLTTLAGSVFDDEP